MGILLKNKWLTFFYPLPSRILTKSNINLSLLSFEEKILSQLDDNQYILLIFKFSNPSIMLLKYLFFKASLSL